ncbi:MAG: TetR/AcrR family transcriptional regulator [Alphaproteobacteria bacterium]|nr:TetR/AcrR family transcriptional regulator [Alphaproteobacteria bacterium]
MKGRPRTFDKDLVLEDIKDVFWRKGYVGTSINDLVEVTGLTKPSLYAAYGNKASMYRASLERYIDMQSQAAFSQLKRNDIDATEAVRLFLKASLEPVKNAAHPEGCLVLSSSAEACGGHLPAEEAAKVGEINSIANKTFVGFFERALMAAGRPTRGAQDLATYLMTLHTGIMQMTTRGLDPAELDGVIDMSVRCIARSLTSGDGD